MSLEASVEARTHSHAFDEGNPLAERNTRRAMFLTAAMMVIEIAGGWYYNSMAVLADGWHMSSQALALGLAVFSYPVHVILPGTSGSPSVLGRSRSWPAIPAPSCYWALRH